jgi:hypothetical protein
MPRPIRFDEDLESGKEPTVVQTMHRECEKRENPNAATNEASKDQPYKFGGLCDQLRSKQKAGVAFPHDSCMSMDLTPDLEAIALT